MNLSELLEQRVERLDGVSRRLWERALAGPAREFLRRPGKGLRGRLVESAFRLAGGGALAPELPAALELLHAGSLVLDDIQDGSTERRGGPSLHRMWGTGVAINTANWMIFWSVELIAEAEFPAPAAAVEAQRRTAAALVACHQGQALDLSLPVGELRRVEVPEVVAASTRLRTASLTELAAALGGLAAGAPAPIRAALCSVGHDLGVALQQLDDLGGLCAPERRQKGLEDLANGRPTWPWAWAAERDSAADFDSLQADARAVAGGVAPELLRGRLAQAIEEIGRGRARTSLRRAWSRAVETFPPSQAREELEMDIDRLERSYG